MKQALTLMKGDEVVETLEKGVNRSLFGTRRVENIDVSEVLAV